MVAHYERVTLFASTALVLISLSTSASAEGPSRSPRVRVLYTGDPISMHYVTPYTFMRVEPLVEVTPVIASSIVASYAFGLQGPDMIRKSIRLYMPRTYKSLVDSYDVIILSDSSVAVFTPKQIHWFAQSVREDGLGLVMAGGVESYQLGAWDQTEVAKILPVDCLPDSTGPGFAQILDVEDEFLNSIPWEGLKEIGFGGSNKARRREWAKELAVLKVSAGGENPMMVVGDIGKGRTFAFTPDWTWGWGGSFSRWEYYGDFCNNLMLYVSRREVPQDIVLLHRARKALMNLDISRAMLISLIDFVEKFGARPTKLDEMMGEIDSMRKQAEERYLEQDFSSALNIVLQALKRTKDLEREAVKAKETALFWIYVSEWLVVSATLLISGFVIWSLMIRRRLYREVGSTRLGG